MALVRYICGGMTDDDSKLESSTWEFVFADLPRKVMAFVIKAQRVLSRSVLHTLCFPMLGIILGSPNRNKTPALRCPKTKVVNISSFI